MRAVPSLLLMAFALAGCSVLAPPAAPPAGPVASNPVAPHPAPPVRIGTPTDPVVTPALADLIAGKIDQQMLVEFLVQADGHVADPVALFTGLSPADTHTALQAFQGWHFKPARAGTQPVEQRFIYPLFFGPEARQERTRFFCRNQAQVYAPDSKCEIVTFGHWRIYRMNPVYPANLLSQHLAGTVTLSFNIGTRGQALDPKVVSANPAGLFDAAALAAVQQWYLEPLAETPQDPPPEHVTVTVKFTPPVTAGVKQPAPTAASQPSR
ncbi:MAG: energy transducer TonB [Gammaproteobacteria bacterium]